MDFRFLPIRLEAGSIEANFSLPRNSGAAQPSINRHCTPAQVPGHGNNTSKPRICANTFQAVPVQTPSTPAAEENPLKPAYFHEKTMPSVKNRDNWRLPDVQVLCIFHIILKLNDLLKHYSNCAICQTPRQYWNLNPFYRVFHKIFHRFC